MKHHYVPEFLQKYWSEKNTNNKILVFSINKPNIPVSSRGPKHTGYENDLFSLESDEVLGMKKQDNEEVLFRYVDNYGAKVIQTIYSKGIEYLNKKDKYDLILFINSLVCRQPDAIKKLKNIGSSAINKELSKNPEEYNAIKEFDNPTTLIDFVEKYYPGLIKNFGIMNLSGSVLNRKINDVLVKINWFVIDFPERLNEILLSDNPCILNNGIESNNFTIALPLGPSKVLFGITNLNIKRDLLKTNRKLLIKRINESSVNQAIERVYASRESPSHNFVINKIRKKKRIKKLKP